MFWGDVPTWITTLAVAFGAMQVFQDRKNRRLAAFYEIRKQAGSVWAYAGSFRGDSPGANEYGVVVANASGLPFRDVEVVAVMHGRTQAVATTRILPPGEFFLRLVSDDEWDYATSLTEYGRDVRPYTRTTRYVVRSVSMTDAAGRRWLMQEDSTLSEVASAPAAT